MSAPAAILRSYQVEGVAAIRAAFTQCRRVLFVLPTGGGKTVCFAFITAHAAAKGNRVIVLAHRQEITDQISIALSAQGVPHGRIQPGHKPTDDLVQVGMVQTVARRLDAIPAPTLLVIDECHHAVAGTWTKITAAWPNAKVLGVTATPERLDGVGLRDAFDQLVVGPDVRELIDAGYLAPFRYLAPHTPIDLSGVRSLGGDFNSADLEDALDQDGITGDVVAHYLKHLAGRTAIAFCVTVAHAEHVAQRFRDAGISAASIDGTMSSDQRHNLVDKLRTGELRVLTSCEIISEGFDAPAVGGAILLRPTQSFALFASRSADACGRRPTAQQRSSAITWATYFATASPTRRMRGRWTARSAPGPNAIRRPSDAGSAPPAARCSRPVPDAMRARCRMILSACSARASCLSARACSRRSWRRRRGRTGSTSRTHTAGDCGNSSSTRAPIRHGCDRSRMPAATSRAGSATRCKRHARNNKTRHRGLHDDRR